MALPKNSSNKSIKVIAAVTGGSGFVGKKLIQNLLRRGYSVKVLTRKKDRVFPKGVEVVLGDLQSPTSDLRFFLSGSDILFNCAGETRSPKSMKKTHIGGTKRIINALSDEFMLSGKKIHWVQLSSIGVYGKALVCPNEKRLVNEQSKINPVNIYETTKAKADKLIIEAAKKKHFTYSILRPSGIVGLEMTNRSFGRLIKSILSYPFFYIGFNETILNYIHVDDVVRALILCSQRQKAHNQIFNLSNDCELSNLVFHVRYGASKSFKIFRIPESIVRLLILFIPSFLRLPLNQRVIDVLVSRTQYKTAKISKILEFKPKKFIPKFALDYKKVHFD